MVLIFPRSFFIILLAEMDAGWVWQRVTAEDGNVYEEKKRVIVSPPEDVSPGTGSYYRIQSLPSDKFHPKRVCFDIYQNLSNGGFAIDLGSSFSYQASWDGVSLEGGVEDIRLQLEDAQRKLNEIETSPDFLGLNKAYPSLAAQLWNGHVIDRVAKDARSISQTPDSSGCVDPRVREQGEKLASLLGTLQKFNNYREQWLIRIEALRILYVFLWELDQFHRSI